jgi:hypothetical protein
MPGSFASRDGIRGRTPVMVEDRYPLRNPLWNTVDTALVAFTVSKGGRIVNTCVFFSP